ncbi:hypothetical protein [Tautonia marina]|uniref:hypothetical protein n=1 Tax=Tautonia marina TaxID=2653855 RepID=UPI0012610246|nr:hypothetical protein [Tautonia marina]
MLKRPSLHNGYLWVCRTAWSVAQAQRLEQELGNIRCELRVWDVPEPGDPSAGQIVELWVHPDDDARACDLVSRISADHQPPSTRDSDPFSAN